jgi:drug/metabolite transporter (DMT)-like permease
LILGILAAMLSALFSVINSKLGKSFPSQVITFYEMTGATITSLIPLLYTLKSGYLTIEQVIPHGWDWLWLAILSLVCTVYAFTVTIGLLIKFSAFIFNLALNLEPVYGIIFAYLIFGEKEQMNLGFYAGTGVILIAILIYPILNKRFGK